MTDDELGGRLPLLKDADLTEPQRALRDAVLRTRGQRARAAGYRAATDDGRLIGPFNALLRDEQIGTAKLAWVTAVSQAGLGAEVVESVILTVAWIWDSPYIRYAHTAAARSAGIRTPEVSSLLAGEVPAGIGDEARLAVRLTRALLIDRRVGDALYADLLRVFDERRLVALVELIGQYTNTAATVACFDVPAPA